MAKKKAALCKPCGFPTFAAVLLIVGIIWLLNEMKLIAINIPWIPIVLIIIAIGMIINRYNCK